MAGVLPFSLGIMGSVLSLLLARRTARHVRIQDGVRRQSPHLQRRCARQRMNGQLDEDCEPWQSFHPSGITLTLASTSASSSYSPDITTMAHATRDSFRLRQRERIAVNNFDEPNLPSSQTPA